MDKQNTKSESEVPLVNPDDVDYVKEIGSGWFGQVYLAKHKQWGEVAVKKFKQFTKFPRAEVHDEAKQMWLAESCPYLVSIMGIIEDPVSIVMKYFENGDLKKFNKKYMMSCNNCWARKVKMIREISLGINYLHTLKPPIIHRNLTLDNVMVGDGFNVRVGDFGLAISLTTAQEILSSGNGSAISISHIPPEVWREKEKVPDQYGDIFMFAITLFELLSGQEPWHGRITSENVKDKVLQGLRPDKEKIPASAPKEVVALMERCWVNEPTERPLFQDIQQEVGNVFEKKHKSDLNKADTEIHQSIGEADTPGEIRRRGPDALKAYRAATEEGGKQAVYRTRLVLVGQERAGKTSLIQKLTESSRCDADKTKPHDYHASNTVRVCEVREDKWTIQEKGQTEGEIDTDTKKFYIWDFAGHDIYYSTHQVFFSNRAVYIIVFDLSLDLEKSMKDQTTEDTAKSRFRDLTGLGFLDFWMQSIYWYATDAPSEDNGIDIDKQLLSPPIFIVGTHRNSIADEKVNAKFAQIRKMVEGKPYEQHVNSAYYAIENSLEDQTDEQLVELKRAIVKHVDEEEYMGVEIPSRWLLFEKSVEEVVESGQHFLNKTQVSKIAEFHGIDINTQLLTMLQFYNDLRTITYFGGHECTNKYIDDMVILDQQWLLDVFKKIMTEQPHGKQAAIFKPLWRRLTKSGILDERLINHVWKDYLPQKQALLALMEKFDLLCPRIDVPDQEGQQSLTTYYVPIFLQPPENERKNETDEEDAVCIFYINFVDGFLPEPLFNRLMVVSARWSRQHRGHGGGQEPNLCYRYGSFFVDDHNFTLRMKNANENFIVVTVNKNPVVTRKKPATKGGRARSCSSLSEPDRSVIGKVSVFLKQALKEMTNHWQHEVIFEMALECPCGELHEPKFHLIPLDDCLESEHVYCKVSNMKIDTETITKWFQDLTMDTSDTQHEENIPLSHTDLVDLAKQVSTKWQMLGIYLGLQACEISSLDADNPLTTMKAFNMLVKWQRGMGSQQNQRKQLQNALKSCGLVDLAMGIALEKDQPQAAQDQKQCIGTTDKMIWGLIASPKNE